RNSCPGHLSLLGLTDESLPAYTPSSLTPRSGHPMSTEIDPLSFAPACEPLPDFYMRVRRNSVALCDVLAPEDTVVQSMHNTSPVKWHLGHTTWFFERFVLTRDPRWQPCHPEWRYLFNSYYQAAGPMHARTSRGMLSRPTLGEI